MATYGNPGPDRPWIAESFDRQGQRWERYAWATREEASRDAYNRNPRTHTRVHVFRLDFAPCGCPIGTGRRETYHRPECPEVADA